MSIPELRKERCHGIMGNPLREFKRNELSMLLLCIEKSLKRMVDDNPKGGVVVSKDSKAEVRMKYAEALINLYRLEEYFSLNGYLYYGICGTCTNWKNDGNAKEYKGGFGFCYEDASKHYGEFRHCYHSCEKHSKEGGGYGI